MSKKVHISRQSISSNREEALELMEGVFLERTEKSPSMSSSPPLKSTIFWTPALFSWLSSEHKSVWIIISLNAYHAERSMVGKTASTTLFCNPYFETYIRQSLFAVVSHLEWLIGPISRGAVSWEFFLFLWPVWCYIRTLDKERDPLRHCHSLSVK